MWRNWIHPSSFTVERHIRGKWDASLRNPDPGAGPGAGNRQGHAHQRPLTQVLIGKYLDHLPLYRKNVSSNGLVLPSRVRRWRNGSGNAAKALGRWWMR